MRTSKKTILSIITAGVIAVGMYSAYKTNGNINFTNNIVAKAAINGYQKSEELAIKGWKTTENFFVK